MSLTHIGVIAQLGERLHGMQEVRGSIPRSSTIFRNESRKGHRIAVAFLFFALFTGRASRPIKSPHRCGLLV